MRKIIYSLFIFMLVSPFFVACSSGGEEPTKLGTPTAVLAGNVATWTSVENAISYEISINDNTSFVDVLVTTKSLNNGDTFKVRAVGDNKNYLTGDWSNVLTYTLQTPPPTDPSNPPGDQPGDEPGDQPGDEPGNQPGTQTQLSSPIVEISDLGLATWTNVSGAVGYKYKINNGTEQSTTATQVQLLDGDSIVVKAVGNGEETLDSAYSQAKTYTKQTLSAPSGVELNENEYTFIWNAVQNANQYVVSIYNQTETIKTETVNGTSYTIEVGLTEGTYLFGVVAKNSNDSYKNSNETTTNFIVEKLVAPSISLEEKTFTITFAGKGELVAKFNSQSVSLTKINNTTYSYEALKSGKLEVFVKGNNVLLLNSNTASLEIEEQATYADVVSAIKNKLEPAVQALYAGEENTIENIQVKHINQANAMVIFSYAHGSALFSATATVSGLETAKSYAEIIAKMSTYEIIDLNGDAKMIEDETSLKMAKKIVDKSTTYQVCYDPTDIVWASHTPAVDKALEMYIVFNDGYFAQRTLSISSSKTDVIDDFINGTATESGGRDIFGTKYVELENAFGEKTSKEKAINALETELEKVLLAKYETNTAINVSYLTIDGINKNTGMVWCRYIYQTTRLRSSFSRKIIEFTIPELISATSYEDIITNASKYTYTINESPIATTAATNKLLETGKQYVERGISIELYYRDAKDIVWVRKNLSTYIIAFNDGTLIGVNNSTSEKVQLVSIYISLDESFTESEKTYKDINIAMMNKLHEPLKKYYNITDNKIMPCIIMANMYTSTYYTYNGYLHRFGTRFYDTTNIEDMLKIIEEETVYVSQECKYERVFEDVLIGMKRFASDIHDYSSALTNMGYQNTSFTFSDIEFFIAPQFEKFSESSTKKYKTKLDIYTKDGRRFIIQVIQGTPLLAQDQGMEMISSICYNGMGLREWDNFYTASGECSLYTNNDIITIKEFINNGFKNE